MIGIDLTGKVALVTGGRSGIGRSVSTALSKAGARVAVLDIIESKDMIDELHAMGKEALGLVASVTDYPTMTNLAREVASEFGSIDILVSSAGTTSICPVGELSVEEWERVININLTGAFNSVEAVLPYLLANKRGAIIFIGSAAVVAGGGGGVHYAASKSALEGLNRGLARELGPNGIRSNIVHPSLIDTELLRKRHPDPESRNKLTEHVPLGRLGEPEDVAGLVAFLASDMAGYITGQSIFVDGGRTFIR